MSTRLINPAATAAAITPHDTNDLPAIMVGSDSVTSTAALSIGVGGSLKVDTVNGDTVTFSAVVAGILPIQVTRVYTTGTTATDIVALYNPY